MKKGARIAIGAAILVGVVGLLAYLRAGTDRQRRATTCERLQVAVLDSARLRFVSEADVKAIIDREYGVYLGQRLDSVDLKKMETVLQGRSAIRTCEAYVTGDGTVHIEVTQREPVVRFRPRNDVGYYADETGFVFPLQAGYDAPVTMVEGDIPLNIPDGFKGTPASAEEQAWLADVIGLVQYLRRERDWHDVIARIESDARGEITLYPAKGKEKFLLGRPDRYADKMFLLRKYYNTIVPEKGEDYYRTVNVKYENQIICRQK